MGELIDRDAAIGALEERRDKYLKDSQTWLQIQLDVIAIRAIPTADAQAEAWNRRSAETKNALLREAAEMIDKRHRGNLPDHIKSEDGNAIRAMIKEDAPRRYMGQIVAECDCSRRQECEAAQKCLADAARALYDTLKKARVGEAYMSDADDGLDCVTLDGIFNLEAIR